MIRAKQSCRQLNSEAIKDNALCFLSPVISGKCSIITAKCVCNPKEKALKKSFSVIVFSDRCKKIRRDCHSFFLGIRSAAFFFSAISTHAKSKAKVNEDNEEESDESDESDEDSPYSQIPSTTTQQWIDGNPALVNKSLCPPLPTGWL